MEIEGHPTQDLVEELLRRGAFRAEGTSSGPRVDGLAALNRATGGDVSGFWLFMPRETFLTGLDDPL